MKAIALPSIFFLAITVLFSGSTMAQTTLNLETGAVFTGRNDVRIPGEGGTLFSLKSDLVAQTKAYARIRLTHTLSKAHTISLLFAPLRIESEGRTTQRLFYNGTSFLEDTPIIGTYKFNSYRATYRYNFFHTPTLLFGLGLTAKIRDANIVLASSEATVERTSFGIVPLPNFYLWWEYFDRFGLLFEGDAYAGPGGRAIDVQIASTYEAFENFSLRLGYRILEGGADNERVYGFALFHYVAAGVTYSF